VPENAKPTSRRACQQHRCADLLNRLDESWKGTYRVPDGCKSGVGHRCTRDRRVAPSTGLWSGSAVSGKRRSSRQALGVPIPAPVSGRNWRYFSALAYLGGYGIRDQSRGGWRVAYGGYDGRGFFLTVPLQCDASRNVRIGAMAPRTGQYFLLSARHSRGSPPKHQGACQCTFCTRPQIAKRETPALQLRSIMNSVHACTETFLLLQPSLPEPEIGYRRLH
jgi:hypothetical protein